MSDYFKNFHVAIKLNDIDDNKTLREKRDIIIDKLKTRLKKLFEDRKEPTPTFSYMMLYVVIPPELNVENRA